MRRYFRKIHGKGYVYCNQILLSQTSKEFQKYIKTVAPNQRYIYKVGRAINPKERLKQMRAEYGYLTMTPKFRMGVNNMVKAEKWILNHLKTFRVEPKMANGHKELFYCSKTTIEKALQKLDPKLKLSNLIRKFTGGSIGDVQMFDEKLGGQLTLPWKK